MNERSKVKKAATFTVADKNKKPSTFDVPPKEGDDDHEFLPPRSNSWDKGLASDELGKKLYKMRHRLSGEGLRFESKPRPTTADAGASFFTAMDADDEEVVFESQAQSSAADAIWTNSKRESVRCSNGLAHLKRTFQKQKSTGPAAANELDSHPEALEEALMQEECDRKEDQAALQDEEEQAAIQKEDQGRTPAEDQARKAVEMEMVDVKVMADLQLSAKLQEGDLSPVIGLEEFLGCAVPKLFLAQEPQHPMMGAKSHGVKKVNFNPHVSED